jgi:hypothetical protein
MLPISLDPSLQNYETRAARVILRLPNEMVYMHR